MIFKSATSMLASKSTCWRSSCWEEELWHHFPWVNRGIHWLGPIREVIKEYIEHTVCEIEYVNVMGQTVGYWAYGYYDPNFEEPQYSSTCWKKGEKFNVF